MAFVRNRKESESRKSRNLRVTGRGADWIGNKRYEQVSVSQLKEVCPTCKCLCGPNHTHKSTLPDTLTQIRKPSKRASATIIMARTAFCPF